MIPEKNLLSRFDGVTKPIQQHNKKTLNEFVEVKENEIIQMYVLAYNRRLDTNYYVSSEKSLCVSYNCYILIILCVVYLFHKQSKGILIKQNSYAQSLSMRHSQFNTIEILECRYRDRHTDRDREKERDKLKFQKSTK